MASKAFNIIYYLLRRRLCKNGTITEAHSVCSMQQAVYDHQVWKLRCAALNRPYVKN